MKAVAASLAEFGFRQPIVVDKDLVIIAGHTRHKAALSMGLKTVPVLIAEDMTPDQVRAYRLADNRTGELADWDFDLLDKELECLYQLDFEMGPFGFDWDVPDEFDEEEPESVEVDSDEPHREKNNRRMDTVKGYNLQHVDHTRISSDWEMPQLVGVDHIPARLIGFNYMLNTDDPKAGIHFYVDDYQFERVWSRPDFYIEKMGYFDCVLTPDFSLYMDMPKPMKIWNIYRSRIIGQMCQDKGLTVIPTVSWAERDSFDYCFEGLPENATLSISTIGVKTNPDAMAVWRAGTTEMIKRLEPKRLIVYGGAVDYDYGGVEVIYYENEVTERMKESISGGHSEEEEPKE